MLQRLGMPASYYAVDLDPTWRLLVLDTTEMSGHSGFPAVGTLHFCHYPSAQSCPLLST